MDEVLIKKPINTGLPQGPTIGPFLFIVFINDLRSCILKECVLYTDDTNVFIVAENEKDLYKKDNQTLHGSLTGYTEMN